jgi:2-oxoglutarate dehydrogenase E1 component
MSALAQGTNNALEAVERLRRVYSGSIGYDDEHVQSDEERQWLRDAAESGRFFEGLDADYQRELLERLTDVETFERFIHQKFPGQKRFSIEGNDMLVPMLDSIIHEAAVAGTHEVVMGMAHRGRLNVLAHNLGKPYSAILAEFQGPNHYNRGTYLGWTGDVKYHLGARRAYRESDIYEMPLTLVPNPSHLEFVNPVVQGRARAAQEQRDAPGVPVKDPAAALPVLIHGDASFPGQGVVAETLNMSRLHGYHTGGTIHIIINNQIGFTTEAGESRSTLYAGDLAKGFEIPVVHVNADDALACIAVARMAWAYRERFAKDFLIDLIGYRRWGHNESDEPVFTQPRMYDKISNHPTVRALLAQTLERQGIIKESHADRILKRAQDRLQRALREVETRGRIDATMAVSVSTLLHRPLTEARALSAEYLNELNDALLTYPKDFQVYGKLDRSLQRRRSALDGGKHIDWAHAEALAFASILTEGIPIRLTGQDTERGTFSQRHLVLHDHNTGEPYVPLQVLPQARASFAIHNSPLSESSTLGFEYGFSMHAPETLVIWEAQFGDFANGAQVIIDQFIVSGYAKWGQQQALVMLLPHGYEGQGPDHSNARPERYLQLAADNNIRVVNCTTSAQYFHLLRRQAMMLHSDPRPLIVFTPKSLLRHPMAQSSLADLVGGRFLPVLIPELNHDTADQVTRLVLCSGKVYVDLMSKVEGDSKLTLPDHIVVARVEELYPFPVTELEALIGWYRNLQEVVWLQEEPENMGAWNHVRPRLRSVIQGKLPRRNIALHYCGRAESASTAEGTHSQHEAEQARILHAVVHGVFEKHPIYR